VNYWVKVPRVSHTTDTTIYLCYGNSAITTDQSTKTSVWDSNFKAVYHLDDQAANTSVIDSTANGTNGVNAANTTSKSVTGKVGKALTYNGTSDNTATGVTQPSSFTWECWFQLTAWTTQAGSSNYSTLMAGTYASAGALLMLWKDSAYVVQFASDNAGGITSGNNSVAPGAWHHVAYTRTGNGGTYSLYFDGVLKGQVAAGTLSPSTTIMLGRRADATAQALNGLLDETRISNIARSADWIKTEYNNQSSPTTFYSISASNSCCDTATARLDPMNATGGSGENPLSRNFNWSLPLVQLPGRAGLDLGISLAYNSLVWTKSGSNISFDNDHGFPSAGFHLGFPVIQQSYFNSEVSKNAFLLIGTDGGRTELRQVGTSALYEAADSSHLLLDTSTMILRTTDGTQVRYQWQGSEFDCTEIKDRNGNYITVNYTGFGRIDTVVDTLGRSIKFNYDVNGWLTSITQTWNQGLNQITHSWAAFEYVDTTISTNFSGLTSFGPSTVKTLSKVTLADGSHFDFTYTSWGQVWKVSNFAADNHVLNYRSYNLPQNAATAYTDCPRFTERHDWAENWNQNVSGVEQEAITTFAEPIADSWTMPDNTAQTGMRAQVTTPDLTSNKIYFIGTAGTTSGWRRGLTALVVTYDSSGVWQRKIMTTWTQDNVSLSYVLNPRVAETNIYDPAGNRARVETTYQQFTFANGTSCQLPRDVYEYAADASTKLRSTRTDYNTATAYTDRRIIGLPSEKRVYEGDVNTGGALASKIGFFYDNDNGISSIQGTDAPVQHDNTNYGASFVTGRANLSSMKRYDVTNVAQFMQTTSKYNTAGAVVSIGDALNHTTQLSYTDSFSDGVSRNTLAYPTKGTDPDGYYSTSKYNFDFGGVTYKQTPPPNFNGSPSSQPAGPEQTFAYDALGRPQQMTNQVNGAYTRYTYSDTMKRVDTYATIQDGLGEAHSFSITDGAGRVIATATDHPGPVSNRFSGQKFVYDVMGRTVKTSNPTETSALDAPSEWATTGDDQSAGWIYSQQTYDWKGRPLVTTNQDGTTKTASYAGCGCAGGEVVTITDEGTLIAGVLNRRQQKIYSDVLGRTVKTEILDWDGTGPNGVGRAVYSAATATYNARDQIQLIRKFAGPTSSSTFQDTTISYDGFGRLKTQHVPIQKIEANNSASSDHNTFNYNNDDTIQSVVEARGVITTFTYNARRLPTNIAFDSSSIPSGSNVAPTASIAVTYDAAGNRTSMSDGSGSVSYHYDQLSRIDWEDRTFAGLTNLGTFRLSYEYNLGGILKKVTDQHAGTSFTESLDKIGRVTDVSAVGASGAQTQFVSQAQYRAWGTLKSRMQGSDTLSFTYNSRLLPKTYSLSDVAKSYEYHNDGTIKFADDQTGTGDIKDRAYAYDAAGRLQQGYSGVEARNFVNNTSGGAPDGPYRHSYTYDQWGNLLQDTGRFWSRQLDNPLDAFDANNRNTSWSYDASGNLLSRNEPAISGTPFDPVRYKYDAAGRHVSSTQTITFFIPEDSSTVTSVLVNSQSYDGDNNLIHYSLVRDNTINVQMHNTTTIEAYLLRSTVLGGRLISEYKADGTWSKTHVYSGGERLGEQASAEVGTPQSLWDNIDPITGDGAKRLADGSSWGNTTLDPGGANVGDSDPFPPDGSADPSDLMVLNKRIGEVTPVEGGRSTCILDGLLIDCSRISENSSVQCPNNDCGARAVTVTARSSGNFIGNSTFVAPSWWDGSLDGTYSVSSAWASLFDFGSIEGGRQFILDLSWRTAIGGSFASEFFENRTGGPISYNHVRISMNPQNTLPLPSDLRDRVASVVNNPNSDCAEFIKRLISQAEDIRGKAFSDDPLALFDRVGQAGFKLKNIGYSGLSSREGNKRVVYINPVSASSDPRVVDHSRNAYAVTALNELMHQASNSGFYSDRTLAQAIFRLLTPGEQQANPLPRSRDADTNSRYFHPLFTKHCHSTTGQ
jgi:YD repeat-containing protein